MDRLLSMRVFQKVIDEGGFAAAARALDMSPAVVTRLVADLENHLGTRLLHRTTRRVSLSPAGENYLNRVRGILQDIDEAHSIASAQTSEPKGVLRVLTPPVLATFLLAPLIAEFRALHPKIRLHVEVDSHEDLKPSSSARPSTSGDTAPRPHPPTSRNTNCCACVRKAWCNASGD